MRMLPAALAVLCALSAAPGFSSAAFDADRFESGDGGLLLAPDSGFIDPYFANKALVVASDAGLDVRRAAAQWITWMLPRQRKDGSFDRYCFREGKWQDCKPADADDAMLALWLQLLYHMAPPAGLPPEWQASAQRALRGLRGLRNRRLGIYYVSRRDHSALLMDNAEVYGALHDVAQAQARFGDPEAARTQADAEALARAIHRVFWDDRHAWFRASMAKDRPQFYPDVLGQTYPLMAEMPLPAGKARQLWERWKQNFAGAWLSNRYDPYSWGLIALTAMKVGDSSTAVCWLQHARGQRWNDEWNVLEEASFQAVESRLGTLAPGGECAKWGSR
ncbi:MAG: hypothetical protein JO041_05315 [Acidobacteria bacterium]|nr:hypothetical protein [Acidobacteriota bacterium]